jgi:hypothetical protein
LYAWLYEIGYPHRRGERYNAAYAAGDVLLAVPQHGGASGGAAGAVFIEDAREHNRPQAKTATGVILVLLVDLATVLPSSWWGSLIL